MVNLKNRQSEDGVMSNTEIHEGGFSVVGCVTELRVSHKEYRLVPVPGAKSDLEQHLASRCILTKVMLSSFKAQCANTS